MVIELPEIIEDIALSKAIEKGEETELVDRESISLKFMI